MKKLICLNRKEVIFLISTIIIGATILRGWVEEFNFENSAKKKREKNHFLENPQQIFRFLYLPEAQLSSI